MRKYRKYPLPLEDVDLSGRIKMETLEELLWNWRSSKDLYRNSVLGTYIYKSGWRCISTRLLRYYRAGLLLRKRKGKIYWYKLSEKGENRLIYLWEKFNCLEPKPGWEFRGELGKKEKELAEKRRQLAISILEHQIERNETQLRRLASNEVAI